jgi:hypothetical protein
MFLNGMVAAGLIVGLASTAAAQQTPPGGGTPPRGGRQAQRNAAAPQDPVNIQRLEMQIQETWSLLVLKQSRTALALSDQQYPIFFAKMSTLQETRDRRFRERRRLLNELGRLTGPNNPDPPSDATLITKAREFDELEAHAEQAERTALAAVDEVLTPFQRARFRVFEEQMDRQKLRMLAQVIRNVPGPGGQPIGRGDAAPAIKPIGRGGGR